MTLRNSIVWLVALLMTVFSSSAQFTYLEAGIGYNSVTFNKQYGHNYTTHSSLTAKVNGTVRFKRHFGIGAELAVPVAQFGKFSFKNAHTNGGNFYDFDTKFASTDFHYLPFIFNYSFKESVKGSIIASFFIDTKINFNVEARLTMYSLTETFQFHRSARYEGVYAYNSEYRPALAEEKIDYEQKHLMFAPGIMAGIKPHLGKNIFLNFNIGLNFLFFNNTGFSHDISYQWGGQSIGNYTVTLESQTGRVRTSFVTNLGLGYYF